MPKFTHKIEDLLEDVANELSHSPKTSPLTPSKAPPDTDLSFPRILDFTFPQEVAAAKVAQIGEVTYVGDGAARVNMQNWYKFLSTGSANVEVYNDNWRKST